MLIPSVPDRLPSYEGEREAVMRDGRPSTTNAFRLWLRRADMAAEGMAIIDGKNCIRDLLIGCPMMPRL